MCHFLGEICVEPWRKEEGAGIIMSITDVISRSSATLRIYSMGIPTV